MLTAIEGYYKDGRVELAEKPPGIQEGKVIVTFLEARNGPRPGQGRMIYRGMFRGPIDTTEEDFKIAEWHPTEDELDA
jgi:hypothetical protein